MPGWKCRLPAIYKVTSASAVHRGHRVLLPCGRRIVFTSIHPFQNGWHTVTRTKPGGNPKVVEFHFLALVIQKLRPKILTKSKTAKRPTCILFLDRWSGCARPKEWKQSPFIPAFYYWQVCSLSQQTCELPQHRHQLSEKNSFFPIPMAFEAIWPLKSFLMPVIIGISNMKTEIGKKGVINGIQAVVWEHWRQGFLVP